MLSGCQRKCCQRAVRLSGTVRRCPGFAVVPSDHRARQAWVASVRPGNGWLLHNGTTSDFWFCNSRPRICVNLCVVKSRQKTVQRQALNYLDMIHYSLKLRVHIRARGFRDRARPYYRYRVSHTAVRATDGGGAPNSSKTQMSLGCRAVVRQIVSVRGRGGTHGASCRLMLRNARFERTSFDSRCVSK